ncbi:MAG: matrixin family metalloprotease [Candidatus Solibacter usitatus]|nr:matrixin family metalloprotease [Candidatus Solibacter usitatus]
MDLIRVGVSIFIVVAGLAAETIHLKTRDFDPPGNPREYLAAPLLRRHWGRSHYLIQFQREADAKNLLAVRERGALVTGYLPNSTVMVSAGDDLSLDGLDVRWAGRLTANDKISPALQAEMKGAGRMVVVVEFHPDVSPPEQRAMAWEQNLMVLERPDLRGTHLLLVGSAFDIATLTEWDEVAYVFPASVDLILGRRVAACAGALSAAGPVGQYVQVGNGWAADATGGVTLDYVFSSLTEKLPQPTAKSEILRAFAQWSNNARVNFVAGTGASALRTVQVMFAGGAHGDLYPFDGPGGVLAHTFYPSPPNPEPIAGDMHLDADERWQAGADIDLFSVVQHEVGHALGFGHTDSPNSVMYPYYRFGTHLSADDIAGVQALYGSRDAPVPPPVSPPALPPPSVPPPNPAPTPPVTPPLPADDTTPPSLTITWPASTIFATSDASITVFGNAGDSAGVVRVTWLNSTGSLGDATGTGSWVATAIPLLRGNNSITVRAYDAAGNMAWRSLMVVRQ